MEYSLTLLDRVHSRSASHPAGTQRSGEAGERAAYFHLQRQGYTIVARRWRHAFLDGELDLISWEGETLCIIEVKTRAASTPFAAEFQVDAAKQRAMQRMATAYVNLLPWQNRRPGNPAIRYDVISVYLGPNRTHDVRLLRDAFR